MILYYTVPLLKNAQYLKVVYMPILVAKQISTLINDLAVKIKKQKLYSPKMQPNRLWSWQNSLLHDCTWTLTCMG